MKVRIKECRSCLLHPQEVKHWIAYNDKAVKRAAILIYDQMKDEEKVAYQALENDKIGFNKYDAPFMIAFAERCKTNKNVSEDDVEKARLRLMKYADQIAKHVNKKRDVQYEWVVGR